VDRRFRSVQVVNHFGISGFESPKCKPKSLADQIPETRKGGFRGGSKLSFSELQSSGVSEVLRTRDRDIAGEKTRNEEEVTRGRTGDFPSSL
jgi:hypothetical protein